MSKTLILLYGLNYPLLHVSILSSIVSNHNNCKNCEAESVLKITNWCPILDVLIEKFDLNQFFGLVDHLPKFGPT